MGECDYEIRTFCLYFFDVLLSHCIKLIFRKECKSLDQSRICLCLCLWSLKADKCYLHSAFCRDDRVCGVDRVSALIEYISTYYLEFCILKI